MTNTLHRFGDAESFRDDFIVFAMASKGQYQQPNPLDRLKIKIPTFKRTKNFIGPAN